MSSEQILKKSMLGGFKKEGVLNYVEQLQNEIVSLKKEVSNGSKCQTELDELKDKKDSADRELSALKAEIEALKSENARLIEQNAAYALKLEEANVSIADSVGKLPWRRAWQHSSILAWRTPWAEDPGGLWSIKLQRIRHR